MIDKNLLEALSCVSIQDAVSKPLKDILEMQFSGETAGQRLERYIFQVDNPYCFRVGDTPVKISFNPDGEALEQKLKAYLIGLKR
ncbi:MAG: hypothetical protein HFF42_09240 [Lawsonibacter sp.]|nr:hypothetical protein [Lawsonibacter sp.]